jgi:hypothetical protein
VRCHHPDPPAKQVGFAADKLGSIPKHDCLVSPSLEWLQQHIHPGKSGLRCPLHQWHHELKPYCFNKQSHQVLACLALLIFPRLAIITPKDGDKPQAS